MSSSTSAKILYLDEDSQLAAVGKRLRQNGYYLDPVDNVEDYFDKLDQTVYDLLLVNCSTAVFDGLEILAKSLVAQAGPVVVMVESGDEKIAARALQAGACTYLVKDHQFGFLDLLPVLVEQGLWLKRGANTAQRTLAEQPNHPCIDIVHKMQLGLHVYQLEELVGDRTFRLIAVNPAASQLTGLAENEALGKKIDEIFPEFCRPEVLQRYAEALQTGQPVQFEQEIYYGDNPISEAWLSFQVLPLPHNCIGVLFDNITLHKQAEESLKRSEARYRAIVEDQTELVDRYLPDGIITFVNDAYCRYFGRKREELIGRSFFLHIPPEERVKVQQQIKVISSENPVARLEHQVILPDGEMRWLEWTDRAIFDEQGRIVEYQAVGRDVTKQKRAEAERERLLAAEREQRLLAETLHEVSLALTAHTAHEAVLDEILRQAGRLVPYDSAHIALLEENELRIARWQGYDRFGAEKLISTLTQSLADFPLEAAVIQSKQSLVIPDTSRELRWVTVKETSWIRSYIATPICLQNQVLGLLRLDSQTPDSFTPADVQRLLPLANAAAIALENARLYEQTRQDAETKSVLLNEVNHRVKNNLCAIIGLIYAELSQFKAQERAYYEAVMQDLVNHVQGLATVHSMLSASKWKPLALSDLAGQVIRATLQSAPLSTYVSIKVTPSLVRVSPKQADSLALVINELATNTIKHALLNRDSGQITVYIETEAQADSGELLTKFEYRDDGPGYPPDVIDSDRQNVGLYLIKKIVQHDLDGDVTLHNEHGAITTIRFRTLSPSPGNNG